jgi:putative PIN family toxin of toxin-antitoxin system
VTRAVLDTNILVSALLTPKGEAAAILTHLPDFTLCLSEEILAEVEDVLSRDRIRRRYPLTDEDVAGYLTYLRRTAVFVSPQEPLAGISSDPEDDRFFACALAASADCIVSRDPHVLRVQDFAVVVLTPGQFLAWLRRQR